MHSCKLDQPVFVGATEFEFEETEDGFFVHTFVISNQVNANNWMVTNEANRKDGKDFEGKPNILFINEKGIKDHTTGKTLEESRKVQEPFRKGTIKIIKGTDVGRKLTATSKIEDEKTKQLIRSHDVRFVSPAIFPKSLEDVEIVRTGPDTHIHIVHRYDALHVAFVDEPAYGVDAAVGPTCEGNGKDCMIRLQQIQAGIGDQEVEPLRKIPLVKIKTSKCSETGNLILEMPAGPLNDCVTQILSEKLGPGEDPTDKDLAIAFSECREKLNKSKAKESKQATNDSNKLGKSSTNIKMATEEEKDKQIEALKSKAQEVEEELKQSRKANEELTEEKKKEEAKRAQEDEDKKEEARRSRKGKKAEDMTDEEKKAAQEDEEKKEAAEDEKKEEELTSKIASQLSIKIPLVQQYVAAKIQQKGLDEKEATALRETLLKASVDVIKAKLDDIGTVYVGTKNSHESEIGYGAESAASKYDNISDKELEEKALGVVP